MQESVLLCSWEGPPSSASASLAGLVRGTLPPQGNGERQKHRAASLEMGSQVQRLGRPAESARGSDLIRAHLE